MRALARFCAARGILVSGSDDAAGLDLEDLKRSGVHILPPDCTDFIGECDMVVFSAAIPYFHPQLAAARAQHIPTLERKAFLGLLSKKFDKTVAVSGTHGKTTVTAMLCKIFSRAGMSFTGHIGGAVKGNAGGIVSCGNEWFVTEACEYNRSFLTLSPYVTAVLNLQFDHPDSYRDMDDMVAAYDALIANTSKDGCIVCSATAERMLNLTGRRVVTFGYTRGADIYPEEVKYSGGRYSFFLAKCGVKRAFVEMKVQGKHNIANCLAAYAVAGECGISDDICACALSAFGGVKGRYEHKGKTAGGASVVYDYAHHPGEIEAAIATARQSCKKRVVAVFEPHTFSRTRALMKEFISALSLADEVIVLPAYKAREEYTPSGSGYDLYRRLAVLGNTRASYAADYKKAAELALGKTSAGDILLVMGAGTVWRVADIVSNYI